MRTSLVCCLLTVAAFPQGETQSRPASAPASKPAFRVDELSAEGKEAFAYLLKARRFTDAAVYEGGDVPREVVALRIVSTEKRADAAFKALLRDATTGGKLYALCGLWDTDADAFTRGCEAMASTKEKIEFQTGCERLLDQPVAELLHSPSRRVVPKPGQHVKEWMSKLPHPLPAMLDVSGGGYPDELLHNGGYSPVKPQKLSKELNSINRYK